MPLALKIFISFIVVLLVAFGIFIFILRQSRYPEPIKSSLAKQLKEESPWIKALGVCDNKDIIFIGYNGPIGKRHKVAYDKENEITSINIYEKGDSNGRITSDIVNKDTDYFKNDQVDAEKKRKIYYGYNGHGIEGYYRGYRNYLSEKGEKLDIDYNKDGVLRVWFSSDGFLGYIINEDVEVVELFIDCSIKPLNDSAEVKNNFKNLRHIIIYKTWENIEVNGYVEGLQKLYPNTKIHVVEYE